MSELDALVELVAIAEDLRRMVELATFSVMVATGFVVGGVVHRFARGH